MLKKNIQPLDLSTMEDSEIEHSLKCAFTDFVEFWEKHGPILLARVPYRELANVYTFVINSIDWLERNNY